LPLKVINRQQNGNNKYFVGITVSLNSTKLVRLRYSAREQTAERDNFFKTKIKMEVLKMGKDSKYTVGLKIERS